jgi:hypothetical protein
LFLLSGYPEEAVDLLSEGYPLGGSHSFFLGLGIALVIILRVLHLYAGGILELGLTVKWHGLLSALSGDAVAYFLFGDGTGVITFVPFWLVVTDCYLALTCLFLLGQKTEAQENRKRRFIFLPNWVSYFRPNRHYSLGGGTTSLFNDFPVASPGVRFSSTIGL